MRCRMLRSTMAAALLALVPLGTLAGCSTYEPGLTFEPAPASVEVGGGEAGAGTGRVLATVIGVRDASDEGPAAVDVRIRVEGDGGQEAVLFLDDATLVSADMTEMRPAPGGDFGMAAASGVAGQADVAFLLPEGREPDDVDFAGLSLRVRVLTYPHSTRLTISFRRVEPVVVEPMWPWWGPRWRTRTVYVRRR